MNNAMTHTVKLVNGRKQVRFVMTKGTEVVERFNGITRRETTQRRALNEMNRLMASGWTVAAA